MTAPSIEYVRFVMRYLSKEKPEETVLRDESGAEVAYRVRVGEFIGLWTVATRDLRIFDKSGEHLAGGLPDFSRMMRSAAAAG